MFSSPRPQGQGEHNFGGSVILNRSRLILIFTLFIVLPFFALSIYMIINLIIFDFQPESKKYYAAFPSSFFLGLMLFLLARNEFVNWGNYIELSDDAITVKKGVVKSVYSWLSVRSLSINESLEVIFIQVAGEKIKYEFSLKEYDVKYDDFIFAVNEIASLKGFELEVVN